MPRHDSGAHRAPARSERPEDLLPPAVARHYRAARLVLGAQALLLLGSTALQPWAVQWMLAGPYADVYRIDSTFGPGPETYLYAGAVLIAVLYAGLAIASIVPVTAMHKRRRWTWIGAMLASMAALMLACMPLGIYVIWVLLKPSVPEWSNAAEVNTQGANSHPDQCFTKVVREWLKVHCDGNVLGIEGMEGFGKLNADYFSSVRPGKAADFVVRLKRGKTQKLRICRDPENAALFVNWPAASDRPVHIALGKGNACANPSMPAAD